MLGRSLPGVDSTITSIMLGLRQFQKRTRFFYFVRLLARFGLTILAIIDKKSDEGP